MDIAVTGKLPALSLAAFLSMLMLQVFIVSSDIHIGDEDASAYVMQGRSIAGGEGLVSKSVWAHLKLYDSVEHDEDYWPPLQSYLIAASLKLFGDHPFAAKFPNVLVFAFLVLLVYVITAKLFSRSAALLAAGMCLGAAEMGLYAIGARNDLLYIVLALACWYAASMALADGRVIWKFVALAGALAGLAFLDRSVSVVLIPTFALWVAIRLLVWQGAPLLYRARMILGSVILFFCCFVAASSPYLVRNLVTFGQPVANLSQGLLAMALQSYQAHPEARDVDTDLSHFRGMREVYFNRTMSVDYFSWHTIKTVFHKGLHEAGITARMIKRSYVVPLWMLFLTLISYAFVKGRARSLLELFLICLLGNFLMISFFVHAEQRYYIFMLPVVFMFSAHMLLELSRGLDNSKPVFSVAGWGVSARGWYWGVVTAFLIFSILMPAVSFYANALNSRKAVYGVVAEGRWLGEHTPEGAVVMTDKPLRVGYYSKRLTVTTPLAGPGMVCRILNHYHVNYLTASGSYVKKLRADAPVKCGNMKFDEAAKIGEKAIFKISRAGERM